MQSLPEDAEALRALILATFAERDAAINERDILQAQNDRLRHLLLKANVELEWFEKYAMGRSYTWENPPN